MQETYACNTVIPVPVLYQPIDSKYINQSQSRIAEKYKKCLTITHNFFIHVHAGYELSNRENHEHQKYFLECYCATRKKPTRHEKLNCKQEC